MKLMPASALAALTISVAPAVVSTTLYDESVSGDLSGDRFSPSAFALAVGSNVLRATSGGNDLEYIRLDVPAGYRLDRIGVEGYVVPGAANNSFIAVMRGPQFTEPAEVLAINVSNLLGYALFGNKAGGVPVGGDLLPVMANAAGAARFAPPLAAGTYTFWIEERVPLPSDGATYALNFHVSPVPEPAAALLLLAGLGATAARWRRMR